MALYIHSRNSADTARWILILFVIVLSATAWSAYSWYMQRLEPPVIPLPDAVTDSIVDESVVPKAAVDNYTVPATHPRYISIPSLGIARARVQEVGLTKTNALDTPRNISDTAWYRQSAHPGEGYGVVLIDGHNGGMSRDGVFVNLDKLKTNDQIIIERGDGQIYTYRVVEDRTESLRDVNTTGMERLMTPYDSTKEGLGLITCAGNWSPHSRQFDKRILVRAVAD